MTKANDPGNSMWQSIAKDYQKNPACYARPIMFYQETFPKFRRMPTPAEIQQAAPLNEQQQRSIWSYRTTAQDVVLGNDRRLAIICGPCSVHDQASILEYGRRFQQLSQKVSETLFCVLRVYIEKPRTHTEWKGFVHDPDLDGTGDLLNGILLSRQLMSDLAHLGIPLAMEFVNPLLAPFFSDFISWGFVGARTAASPPHRDLACMLPFPVGFKNGLDGNIEQAVRGATYAQSPQKFPAIGSNGTLVSVDALGNRQAHVVLRGSSTATNYDKASVQYVKMLQAECHLNSRILIDCSHGNCKKQPRLQIPPFHAVLEQALEGEGAIMGMMLESHLHEGAQPLSQGTPRSYGVSITDPCLGWESTEALVMEASRKLLRGNVISCTHN